MLSSLNIEEVSQNCFVFDVVKFKKVESFFNSEKRRVIEHPHSLTHSHSLSLTLTHSHSLPLTLTHSHSLLLTLTHSHSLPLTLTHSLTRSLAHSLTRSLAHSLTHSLSFTHSPSLTLFCVAGAALGALQGVGCTPWRPLVSAAFCVAGAALAALQGVGCTLWRPLVSAALPVAFAWQAQHLLLCKGSDVRPPPLCR